ncbi:MAG: acyl-CoA thioesterase [Deltaproteobacteria bacterium CG_4_9_14_3_um_filter_63_12]|nr:MAG: acyl-CoA thioesterase [Deltaproteobacteria bacterium CG_4_9_14_3_um_filter_63_12]
MHTPTPRSPQCSVTRMTEIALPQHANNLGSVFGGQMMARIDVCAAISAHRYCGRVAVTAAVDSLVFLRPVKLGDIVLLGARVNAAFNSSIEVETVVHVEHPDTQTEELCVRAFLTFVCLDDQGKPLRVPPLLLEDDVSRRRSADATRRRELRLAHRTDGDS